MSTVQGWDVKGQDSTSGASSSSEALRDRYVERMLEKILRHQRNPVNRPVDLVVLALLVVILGFVIFRGHGTIAVSGADPRAVTALQDRLDKLAAQQEEQSHRQLQAIKALEHEVARLKGRPPVALAPSAATPQRPVLPPPPAVEAPSPVKPEPTAEKASPAPAKHPEAVAVHETKAPAQEQVHVLQAGESLWSISEKYYGDSHYLNALAHYNGIDDPSKMHVGMTIKIPPTSKLGAPEKPKKTP